MFFENVKKEKGENKNMIKKTWKKALAGLCAAAMVMTGISWPTMTVNAEEYSAIAIDSTAVSADSYEATGDGGGQVSKAFDGNVDTFYHTNYGDTNAPKVTTTDSDSDGINEHSGNNTVTIPLSAEYTVSGISITPRQYETPTNGLIVEFKVAFYNVDTLISETTSYEIQNHKNAILGSESLNLGAKEFTFDTPVENVTKVVLTVTKAKGEHISAAEIGLKGSYESPLSVCRVDDETLIENVKANSEQVQASGNDGGAEWAFDDEVHWWHSRWQGTPQEGEVDSGLVSENNPIWIQTGFDEAIYLDNLTYLSRQDGSYARIKDYWVKVANLSDPTAEPTEDDFVKVAQGTFSNDGNEKTIDLSGVKATHVRLGVTSVYANNGTNHVAAQRIKIYELTPYGKLQEKIEEITTKLVDGTPTTSDEEVNTLLETAQSVVDSSESTDVEYLAQIAILEAVTFSSVRIDDEILQNNAKANSEHNGGQDGPAAYAFDDENRWWHSNYNGASEGRVSNTNPIWIQTGFNAVKNIEKITYADRGAGAINLYAIAVANLDDPFETPTDEDFVIVKAGTLEDRDAGVDQEISLNGVEATRIRLIVYSVHNASSNGYVAAKRIKIWETSSVPEVEITEVTNVTLNQTGTVNMSTVEESAKPTSVAVSAYVTPANATDTRVKWTSGDENVATITPACNNVMIAKGDANGVVTSIVSKVVVNAVGEGTTTITATSVEDNTVVETFTVNVTGYIQVPVEIEVGETYKTEIDADTATVADSAVATATVSEAVVGKENVLSNHSGTGVDSSLDSFSTEVNSDINLSDAEFIFIPNGDYWQIYNEKNGNYLISSYADTYFGTTPTDMKVVAVDTADGSKEFRISKTDDTRYVMFYYPQMNFNSNSGGYKTNYADGSQEMVLLEKQATVSESDVIPGYVRATKIVDGNKYLIAQIWEDNNVIVLYPTNGKNNQTKLVRTQDATGNTLTIEGVAEGTTTVTAADMVYDVSVEKDYIAKLSALSITLEGNIGVNYKMTATETLAADSYMQFTVGGNTKTVTVADAKVDAKGRYVFTCEVCAPEMTKPIIAQMFDADGTAISESSEYSVQYYADQMITKLGTDEAYAELVTLLKSMLNYGAYAQTEFGVNTDNLANASLSDADKVLGTLTTDMITVAEYAYDETLEGIVDTASLILNSKTDFRQYLTAATADGYTATLSDTTLDVTLGADETEGKGYIQVNNIPAAELDNAYVLTVSNGTVSGNINFSPLNYVQGVLKTVGTDTEDESLVDVATALYWYNNAANNYFE